MSRNINPAGSHHRSGANSSIRLRQGYGGTDGRYGKPTPCCARAAVQTAYVDDQIPSEIEVTYPPHPCVGRRLPVLGRRRKGRELFWHVRLPDGSRGYLPAAWTEAPGAAPVFHRPPPAKRATPRALRTLLTLLQGLVLPPSLPEAAEQPIASKGGDDGQATGTVREAGAVLDGNRLELAAPRNVRGDRGSSGANGNGKIAGVKRADEGKAKGGGA